MKVLVLHGVNLDMFGKRDPGMYGTITLAEIDASIASSSSTSGSTFSCTSFTVTV